MLQKDHGIVLTECDEAAASYHEDEAGVFHHATIDPRAWTVVSPGYWTAIHHGECDGANDETSEPRDSDGPGKSQPLEKILQCNGIHCAAFIGGRCQKCSIRESGDTHPSQTLTWQFLWQLHDAG